MNKHKLQKYERCFFHAHLCKERAEVLSLVMRNSPCIDDFYVYLNRQFCRSLRHANRWIELAGIVRRQHEGR